MYLIFPLGMTITLTLCGQPDIKALQISLTGFLDKDTPRFCKELWNLCLSAPGNAQGVPKELLESEEVGIAPGED